MSLTGQILSTLSEATVDEVRVGTHWTAVVVRMLGEKKCGLASTLWGDHEHHSSPDVLDAGHLEKFSGRELAQLIHSDRSIETSVGAASINALLPSQGWINREKNALEVLVERGAGKRVTLVGRFPFTQRLRNRVGELMVVELNPKEGEFPQGDAPKLFERSDVIAITGMTFINQSLGSLLKLCPKRAYVMVLGPSTPLSPILFERGVDVISGALVEDVDAVLHRVSQGGNFRQLHRAGTRLVSLTLSDFNPQA
jgi:uncharacterized protein (DUF4213/DUF364 family)